MFSHISDNCFNTVNVTTHIALARPECRLYSQNLFDVYLVYDILLAKTKLFGTTSPILNKMMPRTRKAYVGMISIRRTLWFVFRVVDSCFLTFLPLRVQKLRNKACRSLTSRNPARGMHPNILVSSVALSCNYPSCFSLFQCMCYFLHKCCVNTHKSIVA